MESTIVEQSVTLGEPRAGTPRVLAGTSIAERFERYFVPDDLLEDGSIDERVLQHRYRRIVGTIAILSVGIFVPSLAVAGVPVDRWAAYLATVACTAVVIAASLFIRPRNGLGAAFGAAADALVLCWLTWLVHREFGQVPLLFALVVAAQSTIQGYRSALVMALLGSVLLPIAAVGGNPVPATDNLYTFLYLAGSATVPWIHLRLRQRSAETIRQNARRYRNLVEQMPAVLYVAEFGPGGAWRYVSPGVERLLGFPVEAWVGDAGFWWSRIHPDDRDRVAADERDSTTNALGTQTVIEYRMLDREGRVRWIADEATAIPGEPGEGPVWSGFLRDITDRRELQAQLEHQALHDPLTGLANRALFMDRLEHALSRPRRFPADAAILFVDLDDFKAINDRLGHEAGDAVLVASASRIRECLRPVDTPARMGGDEFAVLLEDLGDRSIAESVAARILAAMAEPLPLAGELVAIGASIGIVMSTGRDDTADELLRNADSAMYRAKRQGKGRHATFTPAMIAAVERPEPAAKSRTAADRRQPARAQVRRAG
jgi:diguanylate cyclase (GGDEF)-like protein/PAS domain S-box-containing protein